MEFILTIDTEADSQWNHGCDISLKNIEFVPRFQDLCNKYKIKPTYLVTSEVCEDDFAKEIFTEYSTLNLAEIGAHLHSWTTAPFLDKVGYRYNDINHAFATELPTDLLNDKIKILTDQIETAFGKRPQSFRSGRYGFNAEVARILTENSYLVDSSVTPYTSWSTNLGIPGAIGGPDFVDKTPLPYKYIFDNKSLIEIPVTILPTRFLLNSYPKLSKYYFRNVNKNIALRVLRKLLFKNQPMWLRPSNRMNISLFEEILGQAVILELPFIVMMFHSSELMPGGSYNYPNINSIENLYFLLEQFFVLLQDRNIASVTLTEAAKKIVL